MKTKVLLPLMLLTLLAVLALSAADGSDADICDDVDVYVQDPVTDEFPDEPVTVNGVQTVKAAVQAAMDELGMEMKLNIMGTNIMSVDGVQNTNKREWKVFQWLPEGNSGWGVQAFRDKSNDTMRTGCSLCVCYSHVGMVDGMPSNSEPTFEPVSTGYVFIRFANGYDPDNEHVQKVFTPEIRQEGFWLEGTGSNMGDVLVDAIERNWPGEIKVKDDDREGMNLSSWIETLFGLGTVKNEVTGEYTYWSQWTWQDHSWGFNSNTLGYYDPAVYKYVECIYLISAFDPYDNTVIADKGGPEPNPEDGFVCMKNELTVDFRVDGKDWFQLKGKYGYQADMSKVPEPHKDGMGFIGWGDVTQILRDDTVFDARFVPVTPTMKSVSYYLEDGVTLVAKEYLEPGSPAVYDGIPVRTSTQQYDYRFMGWDRDLSSVTADISVKPVFEPVLREYTVYFRDFDRSDIVSVQVKYGGSPELPPDPSREPTVKSQFQFKGWSKSPDSPLFVEIKDVRDVMYVYAYYEPSPTIYKLRFMDGSALVGEFDAPYGSTIGGAYALDLFKGEYLIRMYSDAEMKNECSVNTIIVGDTTVYVDKVPGAYDSERDSKGQPSAEITVELTAEALGRLDVSGGSAVICDISQFPNGTAAVIGIDSLRRLSDMHGPDLEVTIIVPRGQVTMKVSDLILLVGDGNDLSLSIRNGPSNVKINTALKKLDYSRFYRVDMRTDGFSVTDLAQYQVTARVGLSLGQDGLDSCSVWNVRPTGATASMGASVSGEYAVFTTQLLQFYAVGSDGIGSVETGITVPYGEVDFTPQGSGLTGTGTLNSMIIDCDGGTLFVPSSHGGCTLTVMAAGCLNGVVNSPAAVVPVTVSSFSWESWMNSGITDVYFLGDCPAMSGEIPDTVTVHVRGDSEGWEGKTVTADLSIMTYKGSIKKDVFGFTYYIVNEEAVLHRYVYGSYVEIPDSIAVGGTSYPVVYVDDGAFMRTDDAATAELYRLQYVKYMLEVVEFSPSVKEIMTRAFYGSTLSEILLPEQVEHIWDEAFMGADRLKTVRFSESLLFIGESAFEGCDNRAFARFDMPDSVRVIGARAFAGCTEMTKAVLGTGITAIPDGCFEGCIKLTDMDIPDGVRTIGNRAFYDCSGLMYADLNNVVSVGDEAFKTVLSPSSMEFIVLGDELESFGSEAFYNCGSVTEIEVHCPHFATFEGAFDRNMKDITVYAADDVMGAWPGYSVEPLTEKIPEKDTTLLKTVEIGLILLFIVIGALSYRARQKSRA